MRIAFWIVFFIACTGFAAWVVLGPAVFHDPVAAFSVTAFFMVAPAGTGWMLYQCIRYEEHTIPFVILALVPYSFVWYYFERYRKRKRAQRPSAALG
jgi:membrane protein implicated in regulation of membrane protease activity